VTSRPGEASGPHRDYTAGDLAIPIPPIDADLPCVRTYEVFAGHLEWPALAVVGPGGVVGMIDRASLLGTFAKPLLRDLYERRPTLLLTDPEPLVVEASLSLDEVSHRIAHEKPGALVNGFVITRGGAYLGIGSAQTLMARSVEQAKRKAKELEQARRSAEMASQAKSSFLANMSHELRTPLNAVIGFADLIAQETFGPLGNARYREYAEDIGSSGRHLLDLISDLLDLSKAEADRLDLIEGPTDLRALLGSCLRIVAEQAERAGVALERSLPHGLPPMLADERKLRQMVLNLLSNAVKFTPPGGRVTLSAALRADGGITVAVGDTGIGMTAQDQEKAMEPFGQVDSSLSRRHKGTGLGLPLTKRLAELHGGALELSSAPGTGTTARLVFPVRRVLEVARSA
jgi:two-component system, cell cycle sensor histidine kinase PleC